MPCIKRTSVKLSCGHIVNVLNIVIKNITKDTECLECIMKHSVTSYGKTKSI